jgi:ketol-acid reductoisomerase
MREITVDIISSKGISLMRYESSSSPKVGETISTLRPEKKSFKVISVDHLIAEPVGSGYMYEQLITVIVEET